MRTTSKARFTIAALPVLASLRPAASGPASPLGIVFPPGTDFVQAGQAKPLLVFGSDFSVEAHQACNDRLCFAPARATTKWTLTICCK